jgi:DNA-binding response OmpR family regulator/two-component sensor histidine kinase
LRFFTNISHELRTPLTLIVAPVENILQTERISQNVRSQLEIVQSNSQRMLRMVNQLLEFRKVQNQKMKLKVQETLLSELVQETSMNFQKEAYDKHIHFEIENNASDSTVWVDRQRMDTILWNLLSNAFKFTPAGKSIRVIIGDKPGFVTLTVKDEGVGIPPEKRNVLFERFSSNNELNTGNNGGTGIGMNLTKELVDLHHGYIEVESEVGKGTTITVLLHTGKDHFGADVDFVTDSTFASQTPTELTLEDKLDQITQEQQDSKRTILIVDDSQDMRQFLTTIMSRDYNVEQAEDGAQAKQILRTKPIDLVISDLMMPNVDGLELTQFIKKNPELDYIPVILLTAKTAIESRLQALQYGADDYVTKPFEPEYIRARVHNILTQRSQLEQSYRQRLMRLEPQKAEEQIPGDTFLAKLLDVMGKQMDNNTLTVDELVDEMGMGRTVFFNKLKSMTGLSPVEFIREMRIKRAAQLLEERKYNITEVTYMVGMNDSRYFAKCFKNTYGVTPSEYRRAVLEKNG